MHIREATPQDTSQIITLLKLSLGEALMPKSEAYWNWKHVRNPFGPSPVLVAEDAGELIGVRAFMRWEWQQGREILKAVRAVDTATHPDHQGKGVFRKLTLALLDMCEREGVDFVFNTPNSKSKPGYLKMGWQTAGKLPVKLTFKRPLRMIKNRFIKKPNVEFLELEKHGEFNLSNQLQQDFEVTGHQKSWATAKDLQFIKWRYLDIPVVKYYGCLRQEGLVVFRLKQDIRGIELRVVDTMGSEKGIENALQYMCGNIDFDYMSVKSLPLRLSAFAVSILGARLSISLKNGPEVTVRQLTKGVMDPLMNFKQWDPTLGDLELF